ncbi:hypothetical protein ESCNG_120014 [Neisseria gonorrhoeae]|nr:hypothetical protein ESCNG_120014 [Neisseria gonorrhoeae]
MKQNWLILAHPFFNAILEHSRETKRLCFHIPLMQP